MKIENLKQKYNLQVALQKLEKEDQQILKQFEKLDNRTNTFLSISLGVFSLQITLFTSTLISIYEKYIQEQNIFIIIILILFIANIFFNITSITNFRKSSKISEKIYSDRYNINELLNNKLEKNNLFKREIIGLEENIFENERRVKFKITFINRGLNNIIISMILIINILIILFLLIGNYMVIL